MPYCAAVNCRNRLTKGCGKTFHRFPKSDPALFKRWTVNMRRGNWTPKPHSTLCSDHFEEKHFDRTGQTTRLRADAVPTIFNFPHLKKTVRQRKALFPRKYTQPDVQIKQEEDTPIPTIHEPSTVSGDPVSDTPANTALSVPLRPVSKAINGTMIIAPRTPFMKYFHHEHSYSIRESPRSYKRKLDKMCDHLSKMKRRLRTTQTRAYRLKKKVESLQEVLKTMKEKNMLSKSCLKMLQKHM